MEFKSYLIMWPNVIISYKRGGGGGGGKKRSKKQTKNLNLLDSYVHLPPEETRGGNLDLMGQCQVIVSQSFWCCSCDDHILFCLQN